jgi:hypothetical protein
VDVDSRMQFRRRKIDRLRGGCRDLLECHTSGLEWGEP